MKFQQRLVAASLFLCAGSVPAFELISAQEMQASLAAPEPFVAKSTPVMGAPQIDIVRPRLNSPITSPTSIQLVFMASAPAAVRMESFKVFYGRLGLDITQRLITAASITPEGIQVKEANLPKGKHRMLLSIEDNLGRQGQRQLDFEVN